MVAHEVVVVKREVVFVVHVNSQVVVVVFDAQGCVVLLVMVVSFAVMFVTSIIKQGRIYCTRTTSYGRIGRGSGAEPAHNSTIFPKDRQTEGPTVTCLQLRVRN